MRLSQSYSTPATPHQQWHLKTISKYIFAIAFVVTYLVHINFIESEKLLVHPKHIDNHGIPRNGARTTKHNHIHVTKSKYAYTNTHSPYSTIIDPSIRISFQLHTPSIQHPYQDKFLSVKPYICSASDPNKEDLPPSLGGRTVLNFTTTIATDLKILHLGDSLGQQFVQGFDASILSTSPTTGSAAGSAGDGSGDYSSNRKVLQEYFYSDKIYSHNCLSVAAPTRGGGISSYWRVTDLMSRQNRRKDAKCAREELQQNIRVGWSMEQSLELVGYNYSYVENANANATQYHDDKTSEVPSSTDNKLFPVGPFDAVIMRIPHGWMSISDITRERLVEAIHLAHDNLGVTSVIITTLPLNNNVLDENDWRGIHDINDMIRDVARTWPSPSPLASQSAKRGVEWVLVQEFGEFTNQILWKNAQHLGYDTTPFKQEDGWELSGTQFLLDRLPWPQRKWPPSIPMVCAQKPTSSTEKNCVRNKISTDGIHWCIESLGPRYSASIACLLGCVYNDNKNAASEKHEGRKKGKKGKKSNDEVRACEKECNVQFMSIDPVEEEWIEGGDSTLFSS